MSDNNNIVDLGAFRKAQQGNGQDSKPPALDNNDPTQSNPFTGSDAPHVIFKDLLKDPVIAPDMLPDTIRMIMPRLAYRFNLSGQKNPQILKEGGMITTMLTISPYSFAPETFRALTDSFRDDMKDRTPHAFQATMRKAWVQAAGLTPVEQENIVLQGFVHALIASTGAYKQTARLVREAKIERLSFAPALMVGHKENDPLALYVEPCLKLSAPISRHGDLRTALQSYLDRIDKDAHGKGNNPTLRPV